MKRLLYILLITFYCVPLVAQEDTCDVQEWEGLMHENVLTIEYGGIWQNDEYLSPLLYNGQMIGVQHEWWTEFGTLNAERRTLNAEHWTHYWTHVGKVHVTGAMTNNGRAVRNQQYAVGVNGGWGAQYNFRRLIDVDGLNIWLGPYAHVDFMGRSIASYTNKPYSFDIAATLRAHAGVSYTIACRRSAYRLQYTLMTDLMGIQFAPDYWQSFYEMSQSLEGTIGFASLRNRQTLQHELSVDMQFRRSTWRVGVRHEYLQYTANNLHFSREQVSVVVGTVFNHRISKTPLK